MDYHFRYSLTQDDFLAFQEYTCWDAPWQKKFRYKMLMRILLTAIITVTITLIILSNTSFLKKGGDNMVVYITCGIMIPLFAIMSYKKIPSRIKIKANQLLEKPENASLLSEKELEISDTGFVHSNNQARMEQKWPSITRYANTKDYFYLYTNSLQGHVIPKRLFGSQDELDKFDKFLAGKIPLSASFRSMGI